MDLAKQMIWLAGLSEKSAKNPDGDIEIKIGKLNQGDKLEEELLFSRNPIGTQHAQIWRDQEQLIDHDKLEKGLRQLEVAVQTSNEADCYSILKTLVPSYDRPLIPNNRNLAGGSSIVSMRKLNTRSK